MSSGKFKGGEPTTDLPVSTLIEMGYKRVSNAYGEISRIDREDWIEVLARAMPGSCKADFLVVSGPNTGKPSERWADHYRRVHSKDTLTVSKEDIRLFPGSY